jgi:hypothetical protein
MEAEFIEKAKSPLAVACGLRVRTFGTVSENE